MGRSKEGSRGPTAGRTETGHVQKWFLKGPFTWEKRQRPKTEGFLREEWEKRKTNFK